MIVDWNWERRAWRKKTALPRAEDLVREKEDSRYGCISLGPLMVIFSA